MYFHSYDDMITAVCFLIPFAYSFLYACGYITVIYLIAPWYIAHRPEGDSERIRWIGIRDRAIARRSVRNLSTFALACFLMLVLLLLV